MKRIYKNYKTGCKKGGQHYHKKSYSLLPGMKQPYRFEIGEPVWYKGKKCIIADRIQNHGINNYALWDETGTKEVKGEFDTWFVHEDSLSKRYENGNFGNVPNFKDEFDEPPFFLADILKKIYDDKHPFDDFDKAVRANLFYQLHYGQDAVVPLSINIIKKDGFKPGNIYIYAE